MQVSVETLSDLERRVTVQVPAERVAREIQNRLQSLSRQVKLHGFRPGKVPLKLINRMYGDQVRVEAVTELVNHSLNEALTQERLSPLSGPKIEPKQLEEGQDLEYSATFEVMPEFEPAGFENLKIERPVVEITDQDVDNMVDSLRWQRVVWNAVERPAGEGDRIRIDFEGRIDGGEFPGGKGENAAVVLGKGMMFKDFEARLTGLTAGAETEFDLTFPANYHPNDVAGKTAHFQVRVHAVEQASLPEIDDAFAESFDVKEGGVAAFRLSLRENMGRELRDNIWALVKRQVMQGLLDANPIPLPRALIDLQIENLARQMSFPVDAKDEKIQQLKTRLLEPEARRRVGLGLLISRLAKTHEIRVDEQRVRKHLESLSSTYQEPAEVIRWYEENPQAMELARALVLEDQVVDWLLERAQVSEKASTFAEIVKPGIPAAESAGQESSE